MSNQNKFSRGFSLVEMAMTLIVIGGFVGAGTSMYTNYVDTKKTTETKESVLDLASELGNFRAVYNRYPCPAALNASPGDLNYGYEDQNCKDGTFTDGCTDGICVSTSARVDTPKIIQGTIPFKSMGLQESDTFDGYGNKLTYAVTGPLTNQATFDMTKGGISVNDKNDVSIITPEHSAHFVIVSHGQNKSGGFTRDGNEHSACNTGGADEQENCNDDQIFIYGSKSETFDDRVEYFTPIDTSHWEKTDTLSQDIYLRDAESISIGASVADAVNLNESASVTGSTLLNDNGAIWAEGSSILTNYLCEYSATNVEDCFKSNLLAGKIDDGEGLTCPNDETPADAKYLVGIQNGKAVCSDEIYLTCPAGSFMSGIEDGKILCSDLNKNSCAATEIVTPCGETRPIITGFGAGATPHGGLGYAISGKYYSGLKNKPPGGVNAPADEWSDNWKAWMPAKTDDQISAAIEIINNGDRNIATMTNHEPSTGASALMRTTYECDDGTWNPVLSHERGGYSTPFPTDLLQAEPKAEYKDGGGNLIEMSLTYDKSLVGGGTGDHDCWCRPLYRYIKDAACGAGYKNGDGSFARVIERHGCPQTSRGWYRFYTDYSNCVCKDDTTDRIDEGVLCSTHYGVSQDRIEGTYNKAYKRKCTAGQSVRGDRWPEKDSNTCTCPKKAKSVNITNCPLGTTNKYRIPGENFERDGVQSVEIKEWECPDGEKRPGRWTDPVIPNDIPPCLCNNGLTEIVTENCSDGLAGDGIKYRKEWVCPNDGTAGDWEQRADWEELSRDCRPCRWKSSANPTSNPNRTPNRLNDACNCGAEAGQCWSPGGANGEFLRYTNCNCTVIQ